MEGNFFHLPAELQGHFLHFPKNDTTYHYMTDKNWHFKKWVFGTIINLYVYDVVHQLHFWVSSKE